jgi:hypothetical protein
MTVYEANKIVQIFGGYLTYTFQKVNSIFCIGGIPESFLPFPKGTLGIAMQTMAQHYHQSGNDRSAKLMQEVGASLLFYIDDEKALLHFAEHINDPKFRGIILESLKHNQKEWLKTQDAPECDPNEKWDGTI